MKNSDSKKFEIRQANASGYKKLGQMIMDIHQKLPGMPSASEQPGYYSMLYDGGARAIKPTVDILVAISPNNELLGGVTFVGDMKYYGSGGTATTIPSSSDIGLLAVHEKARNVGAGKALNQGLHSKSQ